jgi:hypothetical protein
MFTNLKTKIMKIGTKSVLFGAHCFLLHPFFVAIAWSKLYGFPFDPRLWIAFFVHDIGYWGKPNMDGPEGETHVELGAKIMSIFGKKWADFSMYHSRYYAKKHGAQPSKLCFADKLSFSYTPAWLYLPMVNATGEIKEYLRNAKKDNSPNWKPVFSGQIAWHKQLSEYMIKWVDEHKDGRIDTWTDSNRHAIINRDLTSKETIDTIGNCPNCGVEFHIHKELKNS